MIRGIIGNSWSYRFQWITKAMNSVLKFDELIVYTETNVFIVTWLYGVDTEEKVGSGEKYVSIKMLKG